MYTRLLTIWENFRASFWFVPAWLMVAATVAAFALIRFDVTIGKGIVAIYPALEMSPPAARSILSSIVGAMVTSTGVVFSITIVALSLASSQFGSRLIRTFRNRRTTHFTLGVFVSTSLYCILVLASIREVNDYSFVPTGSVIVGILLTVLCLATLVYYIHDISKAIQAPNVIRSSANDLHDAIERLFPSKIGEPGDPEEANQLRTSEEVEKSLIDPLLTIVGERVGYVRAIQNLTVIELAQSYDITIRLIVRPGDFVHTRSPIAEIFSIADPSRSFTDEKRESLVKQLNDCLIIGAERTPSQDVRYAFNELVEIAVRALSPGINDPFTAVNCVDRIHAALIYLKTRTKPSPYRLDEDDQLRVIAYPVSYKECVDGSLRIVENYAADSPMVVERINRAFNEV